jgi:hypothetical protein
MVVAIGLLYFTTQSYLNENITTYISKKSKGKYELTCDQLNINLIHWGFEMNNVNFHPTDSITQSIRDSIPGKQSYSFSSPKIQFNQIHLFKLLFRKQLEIGEILITKPQLKIHGNHTSAADNKSNILSVIPELKLLVTKSFKYIKINKVELVNASFDFYNLLDDTHRLSKGENITIGILNFYTDSLLLPDPGRLFNADDIYLRMNKYQNKLGDSIHILSAETVIYSLKKSQIEAGNIELKPINQVVSTHSKYQVFIPKAVIKSRQINEFYKNKIIPIDSVVLTGAKIKYWPGEKNTKLTLNKIADLDLFPLIENEFAGVSIANFKIDNAQVVFYRNQKEDVSQQELKNIHLNLEDFLLDSISSQDTSRIFYSKNIDVSASDYELTLGDNIHKLKTGRLSLSTQRKFVSIYKIELFPLLTNHGRTNLTNTINVTCDSVKFNLFDFKKAWHFQRFYFQAINAFNPQVQFTQNELAESQKEPESTSFVYNLISNYLKGIYSQKVSVRNGKFKLMNKTGLLQKGLIETSFKLYLNGFALDENSAKSSDKLFFANQIELNLSDYQMQLVDQLHKLTVENLSISTLQKQASIQNLHLFPVSKENIESRLKEFNRSELYEFTIPELSFDNANFHEAFFNKKFHADLLTIKNPNIYYENFALLRPTKPKADFEDLYFLISNYLDDIHLDQVDIPDGNIQLINHNRKGKTISLDNHFSLGLENMLINKDQFGRKKLLFSDQVEFSVRDHIIRLSDNVHVIKAGTVGFSTKRKEVYLTNAKMYPETTSKDFSAINWNIQLAIPEIRIKGINIGDLYFDQKIAADNVMISSPEIKLYQKNINTRKTDLKEISFPLPEEIESISIGQFNLNNGSLKIFSELGMQPYLIVQSDLKMESQDILVNNNQVSNKTEFKRGKYTAGLINFRFTPKDINQQISIEGLQFSTSERQIVARQLTVKPKTQNTQQDQFEMQIPLLSMNGFDIDNAYRNYQYFFESIVVEKPSLILYNNARDSIQINPFDVNIYPHFKSFADVFATKSLKVHEAGLTVFKNGRKTIQEKITFDLTNFRIDEKPSKGFLHATDFSFSIQNTRRQDARNLYQFSIGESEYSSQKDRFTARDIRIIPSLSKEKFNRQNGFQSDYFQGKLDSVVVSKPNIQRWFDKGELAGKELSVIGLDMDIYRDKRLPFDEKRRPMMLQDLIKKLPYPIQLDSLKLIGARIRYNEQPPLGEEIGYVKFSNLDVCLKPFTNMKGSGATIPDFQLDGTATIMDSCQMKVKMSYLMNHPDNLFKASGSLSPFNMWILNPALEPLAMVSIRSGRVNQFNFNLSADNKHATGQLTFGYNDMRISVLELKDGNTKESKFASFIANSLMLRSKNPRGKELLPDEINFQRDLKRSVVNYWWKSIFSGVRNTLGIKESKEEPEEKTKE